VQPVFYSPAHGFLGAIGFKHDLIDTESYFGNLRRDLAAGQGERYVDGILVRVDEFVLIKAVHVAILYLHVCPSSALVSMERSNNALRLL
jgi:hypothetical protein